MKWKVTVEIDDPQNLIEDCEFAKVVVEDLLIPQGHEIGDNCDFEVTRSRAIELEL